MRARAEQRQPEAPRTLTWCAAACVPQVYRIPVRAGPEGRAEFKARVKALFNLSNQFDCTFDTKLPGTGEACAKALVKRHAVQCGRCMHVYTRVCMRRQGGAHM